MMMVMLLMDVPTTLQSPAQSGESRDIAMQTII